MEKDNFKNFLLILSGFKTISSQQRKKIAILLKRDLLFNEEEEATISSYESEENINKTNEDLSTIIELSSENHRIGLGNTSYKSPKILQYFLRLFNQDDILKYTCHLIDTDETIENICKESNTDQYDFIKHVELIKNRYNQLLVHFKKQNIFLSPNMATLINVYLTGENLKGCSIDANGDSLAWSSNKIRLNWNCEELKQWAKENPHIIPNPGKNIGKKQKNSGYNLQEAIISKIDGKRIKSFSELVIFFKNQFHLRKDNSLRSILTKANERWGGQNVNFSFAEGKFFQSTELFTDIDKLIQAYHQIIRICSDCNEKERKSEPARIELSFYDDADSKSTCFCIHHINTIYGKDLKSTLERIGEAQSDLIKNQINGLCDLYIEAKFEDGKQARINLWDENKIMSPTELENDIEGVKYILKF